MNKILARSALLVLALIGCVSVTCAQGSTPPPPDDPDFIVPARPTISNPAEFQRPGVLQLEFGYNSNFHAPGVSFVQDLPLSLRFAASRRVLLEYDGDNLFSQTVGATRATGVGDSQLGIQFVLRHENESGPGVAFAYYVKIPTASSTRALGTGRVDHNFIALVSKQIGKTTLDFNATYLVAGRISDNGHASSGQAALAVSHGLTKRFALQGEVSGFSRNDQQSGALSLLGAVTFQVNHRLVLDSGMRVGLTSEAPRAGVFAGMTVGLANLYRRHHSSGI